MKMKLDSSPITRSNRFLVYLHGVMLRFIYLFSFDKDVSLVLFAAIFMRDAFNFVFIYKISSWDRFVNSWIK